MTGYELPAFEFELLTEAGIEDFVRAGFNCGEDGDGEDIRSELNKFLPENSWAEAIGGFSKTYLFYTKAGEPVGYVAFSCQHITNQERAKGGKTVPILPDPPFTNIPTVLIGRLAVDKHFHNLHFGETILRWARDLARELPIGCRFLAVHVQPTNEGAIRFYTRHKFVAPDRSERRDVLMLYDLVNSEQFPEEEEEARRTRFTTGFLTKALNAIRRGDASG